MVFEKTLPSMRSSIFLVVPLWRREREKVRERARERGGAWPFSLLSSRPVSSVRLSLVSAACHGDHFPGRYTNTGRPSVGEGHDVERVTLARTMSAMVKLTQENDESCVYVIGYGMVPLSPRPADCGKPLDGVALQEKAGYTALTRAGRSRIHRGACLGDGVQHGVPDDVFPRQALESNALLFSLKPTAEDWLHGEVVALDSRPAKESDCSGSHARRVLTNSVTLNEAQGRRRPPLRIDVVKDKMSADEAREGI